MNRMRIVFCTVIFTFLAGTLAAQYNDYLTGGTKTGQEGSQGTIKVLNANVRYGPDKNNFRIITTLKQGDKVTVFSKKDEWYEINFPSSGSVWIFADYVDLLGNQGTVNADNVTLRDDARFEGLSIGALNKGDRIAVASQRGKWYRIVPPASLRAYVFADLVDLEGPERKQAEEYFRGKLSDLYMQTTWRATPEGKDLMALDKQLWIYKTAIRLTASTIEELEKTRKDIEDISNKVREFIDSAAGEQIKEEARLLFAKTGKIIQYIDAVIAFKRNYMLVEKVYKENIAKITRGPAAIPPLAGCIDDVGRFSGRKTPFVLVKADKIVAYITSDEYNLRDHYYREVVVTDYAVGKSIGGVAYIKIKNMEIKGVQTWKNPR